MSLRINRKELELIRLDGGGVPFYHFKGKPFTGIIIDNYDNGNLFKEEEYLEGYQEGWTRYYFENGKIEQEDKSHNNKLIEGTYKEWDEEGNLIDSF
jgi:antitoxin component YwqK of YwqJK toxin-antitoxin module